MPAPRHRGASNRRGRRWPGRPDRCRRRLLAQTISAWTGSSVSAWCDCGDIVFGGGWESTNTCPFETIYFDDDAPVSSSGSEGWRSSIASFSEDDSDVTTTAICVSMN